MIRRDQKQFMTHKQKEEDNTFNVYLWSENWKNTKFQQQTLFAFVVTISGSSTSCRDRDKMKDVGCR